MTPAPAPGTIDLGERCWLRHEPQWLAAPEADGLFATLREELRWEQREIVMFGRRVMQPRLIAWAGPLPYRYSGQTLPPRPAPATLQRLSERVCAACGHRFNHVLANLYRDGRDSMGMHSDDEPELGPEPLVASVSLGAPRRFVYAPKEDRRDRRSLSLGHGALLVMGGRFQHHFVHGLPKTTRRTNGRLSLTFRRVLHAPERH